MQPEINPRVILTLPLSIFLIFINSVLYSATIGIISARYRDVEPTIKALMAPMLLLTPVLWKPEMLGEYINYIYINPFTYFIGIVRNDLIGDKFDIYVWYGAIIITILQLLLFLIVYSAKRNRIVFWV
jgi:ABC-2 type transport system permease protein/lipopolysaccharide transport system permease protein